MEWIDVNDRLPPEGELVLVYAQNTHYILAYYWNYKFVEPILSIGVRNFTHWMPLPQPPKSKV